MDLVIPQGLPACSRRWRVAGPCGGAEGGLLQEEDVAVVEAPFWMLPRPRIPRRSFLFLLCILPAAGAAGVGGGGVGVERRGKCASGAARPWAVVEAC